MGCKYRYIEKPERLLSPEEMSEVICELAYLYVVEEQGAFEQDSVLAKIGKKAFVQKLYEQYGIDKQILRQNKAAEICVNHSGFLHSFVAGM